MSLESRLAQELIERHPERAAALLERLDLESGVELLERVEVDRAAALLERLSPSRAESLLAGLPTERVADLFEAMNYHTATRLARCLDPERLEAVLAALPPGRVQDTRSALRFPENSAGALMDPQVLALPIDFDAGEALARLREFPSRTHYNLYVVDGDQKLAGVLNLRELFLADPKARLRELMHTSPLAVDARSDRTQIVSHRGWHEVHSLPVVDEQGVYLGALRYRTLRALEDLLRANRRDAETPQALGELFAAGAGGLLGAFTSGGPVQGGN